MKITRYIFSLTLLAVVVLCTQACGEVSTETVYTPGQIARVVIASQEHVEALHPILPDDEYFYEYLDVIYLIGSRNVADGVIYYSAGMLADEIAVLLLTDEADSRNIKNMLESYIDRRIAAFTGYAPEQTAILENGRVIVQGRYVALIICDDARSAGTAFIACFSDNPPEIPDLPLSSPAPVSLTTPTPSSDSVPTPSPSPSPTPSPSPSPTPSPSPMNDFYDPDSILAAWRSGDLSQLTYKNRNILEKSIEIINDIIVDDMTDYEKVLTIHDWIIDWAGYDTEANNNAPNARPDPDNDNPYGLLFAGKAICTGYTFTFQLFMDLLSVECITVHGIAITGGEHAWNMVRIEGEWYCVDVTWNDPIGAMSADDKSIRYKYFNVPSQVLRDAGHQWDESSTPEATAPKLFQG